MSRQASTLLGAIRRNFDLLREHDKVSPAEVDQILATMITHIRSWRPHVLQTAQIEKVDPAEVAGG